MKKPMGKFTVDTSITIVTRILQLILGLGFSIVIARFLGPQGRGVFALAFLLPQLLATFGNLGMSQASIFYIGKKKYPPVEVLENSIFLSLLRGAIFTLFGLGVVYFFCDSIFPKIPKMYLLFTVAVLPVRFLRNSFINCILGLQRIKEYNFLMILPEFLVFVLVLIFLVALRLGVGAAIAAQVLSGVATMIAGFCLAKRLIGSPRFKVNSSYIKDACQYGLKIYAGNAIGFLHYRADIFLVNIFLNPFAVGLYSTSVALAEKIWIISKSAGVVLFPRVSSETDEKMLKEFTPRVCRNILLISFCGIIPLFLLGRFLIVFFYSDRFLGSVGPLQILLIGVVAMSGWRVLANDLYGRGKPELNIYISAISFALNIVLNIFWIPKFGITGAAWATTGSYTLAFAAIILVYSNVSGNKISAIVLPQRSDFHFYKKLMKAVI